MYVHAARHAYKRSCLSRACKGHAPLQPLEHGPSPIQPTSDSVSKQSLSNSRSPLPRTGRPLPFTITCPLRARQCAPCGFQAMVEGHCLGMKTGNETCRLEKRGVSDRTPRWLARRLFVASTSRACATREESSGTEPTRSSRSWSFGG